MKSLRSKRCLVIFYSTCYNKLMLIKRGGLVLLSAFLATSFVSYDSFASETASSTFSIDVSNAALQVTAPATASIELNPTSSSAVFGSTNITVNVATNNTTGYTITMTVPTTDLTHNTITGDDAPVIPTLQSQAPESTFPANAWGYKVTGDNYNPAQLTNTNPSWATENPTNGTDHIITLAAKVDGTKHSGTYTNTLTFNVVANPVSARDIITFDANGGTGSMDGISVPAGDTVTLPQNTFTAPEGYRFSGWNAVQTNVSPTKNIGVYTNKAPYTAADTGINRQITLYAEWTNLPCTSNCDDPDPDPTTGAVGTTLQRAYEIAYTAARKGMYEEDTAGSNTFHYVDSWNGATYQGEGRDVRFLIQDMTPEICASATAIDSEAFVLDIRDQKSYWIAKLADGKCWMTQNLDLDLNSNVALTNATTDLNSKASWTPSNSTINFTGTTVTGWTDTSYEPRSANPGDEWIVTSGSSSDDTVYAFLSDCVLDANISDAKMCQHYHTGNYYNWPAAVAENDINTDYWKREMTGNKDAPDSICPKGWRLSRFLVADDVSETHIPVPLYGILQNIHYSYPYLENGFNIIRSHPLYRVRAGTIRSGGVNDKASAGYYFDSTLYYHDSWGWFVSRGSDFGSGGVGRASAHRNNMGNSIRCIAR